MKPQPWRYKSAYWLFAVLLVVAVAHTMWGVGGVAWNSMFGDDTPSVSVDPTPTPDTAEYQWPH